MVLRPVGHPAAQNEARTVAGTAAEADRPDALRPVIFSPA